MNQEGQTVMRKYKTDAVLVFALLAFTYAYFYQDPGWNGNSRLGLAFALVQEGRFAIDSFHEVNGLATGDKSFFNGHYYSDKAIGSSVVAAIVYFPIYHAARWLNAALDLWLVKYSLTVSVIALPAAVAGSLMYRVCRLISGNRLQAGAVTASVAVGTMYFPYSVIFFGHVLAAALLFCAFFLIFRLRVKPNPLEKRSAFLVGLLLGLAVITEYTTAVIVASLILYYLYTLRRELTSQRITAIVISGLGGLIPAIIVMTYNTACFGAPFSVGYEHLANEWSGAMSQGLMGIGRPNLQVLYYLTFHPARGLFWQSPVLLMAWVGGYFMFRAKAYRPEALVATTAFVSYLLINSGYFLWWGGDAFGPRHLIPMLPFLCLPLIFVPRRLIAVVVVLGIVSMAQMFIAAASNVNAPQEMVPGVSPPSSSPYSTIYNYCLKQLVNGKFALNLGRKVFGLRRWPSLFPLLIVNLGLIGIMVAVKPARAGA